jgi:multimeric flavodoxin WrbA
MKTLAVLGSFRKGEGNTSALLDQLTEELRRQDAPCESIWLPSLRIEGCRHCNWCMENPGQPRRCIMEDGMQELYAALEGANVLLVASPVYMWNVSAQTKAFLDRLYPYGDGSLRGKRMAAILTSGGDAFDGMDLAVQSLQRFAEYFGMDYAGTLHVAPMKDRKDAQKSEVRERVRTFAASILA